MVHPNPIYFQSPPMEAYEQFYQRAGDLLTRIKRAHEQGLPLDAVNLHSTPIANYRKRVDRWCRMYPSQDARYTQADLIANINFDIATFAQCKVEIETLEQYVENGIRAARATLERRRVAEQLAQAQRAEAERQARMRHHATRRY